MLNFLFDFFFLFVFNLKKRQHLMSLHTKQMNELHGIITAVEAEEQKRVEEAKQAHETEREEIRNKNLEDINMLRISLENKIEDLEKQFDEVKI